MTNFFISYQQADRPWAEWVAWHLEEAGYTTVVQAWDFRPGCNFVLEMQRHTANCDRTIAILSPAYLDKLFTHPEWAAAFAKDPKGENRTLIPIRVRRCSLTGLLAQIVYIDLVSQTKEPDAVRLVLDGVAEQRVKPTHKPSFPADENTSQERLTPYFPNDPAEAVPAKYTQLVRREFQTIIERRTSPIDGSKSCELMFGHQFPFGKTAVVPQISRCAVAYDVEQFLSATVGGFVARAAHPVGEYGPHIIYKAASTRWRLLVSLVADGLAEFNPDIMITPLLDGFASKRRERKVPNRLRGTAREFASDPQSNGNYELSSNILHLIGVTCRDNGVTVSDVLAEEQNNYRYQTLHTARDRSAAQRLATCGVKVYFKDHKGAYDLLLKSLAGHQINIIHSESWTLIPERVAYTEITASFPSDLNLAQELAFVFSMAPMHDEVYSFSVES